MFRRSGNSQTSVSNWRRSLPWEEVVFRARIVLIQEPLLLIQLGEEGQQVDMSLSIYKRITENRNVAGFFGKTYWLKKSIRITIAIYRWWVKQKNNHETVSVTWQKYQKWFRWEASCDKKVERNTYQLNWLIFLLRCDNRQSILVNEILFCLNLTHLQMCWPWTSGWFLGMTRIPFLPIRELPEVNSIGQVSWRFMALGGI